VTTFTWLQAVQITVTLGGFAFAIWQLRREYRWRRKQFALHILAEWNEKTDKHRRGVEEGLPGLLDADPEESVSEVTEERAEAIYRAKRGDTDRELRTHIVELLNYGEYVAVSYAERVGDRKILMESFGRTITRWYRQLEPYVRVTARHRGFNPWQPLGKFVADFEHARRGQRPGLAHNDLRYSTRSSRSVRVS
jgi:hypothetical protein